MLFHGSPIKLNVGDTLLPGEITGKTSNGACSAFVYATTSLGFSLTEASDFISDETINTAEEFAIWDAAMWGCSGNESESSPVWVYLIDGEIVGADEHMDAGPAAVRLQQATILKRHKVKHSGYSVDMNDLREFLA